MLARRVVFIQLIVMLVIGGISGQCDLQCQNGGRCVNIFGRWCWCTNNFFGDRCGNAVNDPQCQNGGTWAYFLWFKWCKCENKFIGDFCEIPYEGQCPNNDATNVPPLLSITFGCGSEQYSAKTPRDFNFITTYQQEFSPAISMEKFSFVNAVPNASGAWHDGALDHTTDDANGYVYLVNVADEGSEIFKSIVDNICIGLRYEFSAYVANLIKKQESSNYLKPNIRFEVRSATAENEIIAQLNTGDIPEHEEMEWSKYGLPFVASTSSVVLLIISNIGGDWGNDLAIDDIELRVCSANYVGFCPTDDAAISYLSTTITLDKITSSTDTLSTTVSSTQNSSASLETHTTTTTTSTGVKTRNSTSLNTSTVSTTQMTMMQQTSMPLVTSFFTPEQCNGSTNIGLNCIESSSPCDILEPCQNNGTCTNTHDNYSCSCLFGFNGTQCQFDHRLCKPHTCLDHGVCNQTSNTTFSCSCFAGWTGKNCETMIHNCHSNPCMNKGICRLIPLDYECRCLGDSYSGRRCEVVAKNIKIYKILSTSFAYVAIIAMASVAMFVVIMDILKYCFGIDPVHEERERIRRKRRAKKRKPPVIQRFVYVNAPPSEA